MSRDLKFRAKDQNGKYRYSDEFGALHQFFLEVHLQGWTRIEQYICVDDVNGKEIYEGDEVIATFNCQDEYFTKSKHTIKYYGANYPGFDLYPPSKNGTANAIGCHEIEVTGR